MLAWFSVNLINIALVAVLALITGFLLYSVIRDKKKGKSPCGGNCSACGTCSGCSTCGKNVNIKEQ